MKKSKFNKLAVAACALLMSVPVVCMPLSACGKKPDPTPPPQEDVAIVQSITLDTANVKTNFAYRETFSSAGLTVTANMSDGTTETLPLSMCNVSSPDMSVAGVKTVTVTYKNIKATYQITVAERVMPTISSTPLAEINANDVYRIEAENIDYKTPGVNTVEGKELVVKTEDESVSGGAYVANYGVEGNYFGFTFTADKEYKNATLVFRAASPVERQLGLGANMNMYINYKSSKDMGQLNIADVTALPAATPATGEEGGLVMEWGTRILRNVTIPAGTNTLTFDVLGTDVVCLDYVEIYAGVVYGTNSITELNGVGTVIKDVEDFDLEKIVVRDDVKNAHGLPDGVAFVENTSTNLVGTHGGKAVGAMAKGSEITTALSLKDKATVHILYATASVGGYKVKDNYEFYIDGEPLKDIEDYYVKAGNSGQSQWWEWRDTSLGYVDLEAGDHIFTVKVTGSDCNCDCFKFEVLSYGEFIEHPAATGKINVNGLGTYTMEGENIDLFDEKGTQYIKSDNGYYGIGGADNCSAGRYINGFNAETKFIFTVSALKNTTVDIAMKALRPDVEGGAAVADSVKLYLGETEIPVSATASAISNTDWKTITLAEGVQLEGGKLYTFTMEVTNPFWLDCISFVTTEYNGEQASLDSIRLDTSAVKKDYEINDTFSTEGLTVAGVMTNGSTSVIDLADCEITAPDMTTAGEKTVTVTYGGKSETYTIIVHAAVESIEVNAEGAKHVFNVNEEFSAEGVTVTAILSDGTTLEIAIADCEVTAPDMTTEGEKQVSVTYSGKTQTYNIAVVDAETVISGNGSFDMIASNLKKDGVVTRPDFVPVIGQGNYGVGGGGIYGFTAGTVFTVDLYAAENCNVTVAINLHSDQTKIYGENFEFTMDGMVLTQLNPDATMTPNDAFHSTDVATLQLSKGAHVFSMKVLSTHFDLAKITFTASEYGEVEIEDHGTVTGITLNTEAALKEFFLGDAFTSKGIAVIADTTSGKPFSVSLAECEIIAPDMTTAGEKTVTVKYGGFEATYNITVTVHATLNTTSGTVTVEAENIDRSGVIQDAGAPTENWSVGGNSGVSLRGVQTGSVLNMYIQAEENLTVNFIAVLSKYEELNVNTMIEVTVDGKAITVPSVTLGRMPDGSNDWFNWKDVDFGDIELSKGAHVISIKVIGAGPNMDCFKFQVKTAG